MKSSSFIFDEDYNDVLNCDFIDWNLLKGQTIFITGATGLIGTSFIKTLDYISKKLSLGINLIALVRDEKRARDRFEEVLRSGCLKLVVDSIENLESLDFDIDYIVHGASQTASKEFVKHAVETINTSVLGTMNMLKIAYEKSVKGFVYLSSMEVYGYPQKGHKVKESEIGALPPLDLRNSYPISKVMSESMCCAYAEEYDVPAMICRLTQTFGPSVNYNDTRVFAYFGRCVNENKNIVLKTKGETERSYLYVLDAVSAILTVLLKGTKGNAYNVADESTYCSIAEMAEKVALDNGIKVEYDIQDEKINGFPQTLYMDLDTQALRQLGWKLSSH